MGSIDQHHAGDFIAIEACKEAHVVSAHRVADQDIRRGNTGGQQQLVKLTSDHFGGARLRTWIGVSDAGTVVRAHAGKPRDLRLHFSPGEVRVSESRVEDYRWASFPGAVDVHLATIHIYELAEHGVETSITCFRDIFV